MDNLRFYMVTWNVATKQPEENLLDMLGFGGQKTNPTLADFYVISLQEVKSQPQNIVLDALFDDPWTNAYKDVLADRDYVKVKTIRLQGILLSLYCLRKHLLHLRDIETQYTKTGFRGIWGNKGAVSIRLSIYGCSVCMVNCHLTAHDGMMQERITDYNTIIKSQAFQTKETANILYHDYVFWMGDLNFRLMEGYTATEIERLVQKGELTQLLELDELQHVRNSGEAFSELTEHLPIFPPTYKFELHSSSYDLKRRPSWTDRVLYRVNAHVYENLTLNARQLSYRCAESYMQSDHKPVMSEFIIKVFSDYYERVVEFQPVDPWYIDSENSASYTLSGDVQPTLWDWVGVFKDGFASLDEYLCYVYAVRGAAAGSSRVKRVTFPDTAVRVPGPYRLLYFSNNSGSVLGMSAVFQVCATDSPTQSTYSDGIQ